MAEVLYNPELELTLRWAAGPASFGLHLTMRCEYVARATQFQDVIRRNLPTAVPWEAREVTDERLGSDPEDLSKQLAGLVVAELTHPAPGAIAIHFTSGAALVVRPDGAALSVVLRRPQRHGADHNTARQPTRRQREYLEFINKYMARFGAAPAESDIQRHFLVSAPSVNQMIRTLERRGFIERDRDWSGQALPRSIRVVWNE